MRRRRKEVYPAQARKIPVFQGPGAVCALRDLRPNVANGPHLKHVRCPSKSVSSSTTSVMVAADLRQKLAETGR